MYSFADAVHFSVRDVVSCGKLLAGQDGGGVTLFALQHSDERTVRFQVVTQLPEPVPLRCPWNLMVEKVAHDSNLADQIQDQRLEFT